MNRRTTHEGSPVQSRPIFCAEKGTRRMIKKGESESYGIFCHCVRRCFSDPVLHGVRRGGAKGKTFERRGVPVSWRTVGRFVKDRRDAPTLIQMLYRANYVLFGLSIAENMYPGQNLSIVSVLAAFVVPMFNILAVILFEVYRGGENISLVRLLLGVLKNPLVIGSALGLLCNGLGLPLPQLLQKPLQNLGAIATPLALVCTGATLTFGGLRRYRRCLMWATAGRLVILPGIFLTLAVMMGFRGMELTALFLIYACPVAASSYPMAVELGGNGELAGLGVAVSHVACLVTIFLWIAFLNFFALC